MLFISSRTAGSVCRLTRHGARIKPRDFMDSVHTEPNPGQTTSISMRSRAFRLTEANNPTIKAQILDITRVQYQKPASNSPAI